MSIGAGQLLWWDELDLSHDIRVADAMAERQFEDRTGLIHKRTQNRPVGVVEDGLSLSGFFDADHTGQLIADDARKTGGYVSRIFGETAGAKAILYRNLHLPSSGYAYNIGGFIDFAADGLQAGLCRSWRAAVHDIAVRSPGPHAAHHRDDAHAGRGGSWRGPWVWVRRVA